MAKNNKNNNNVTTNNNNTALKWPKNIPNYMCGACQKILSIVKNDVGWPTVIRVTDNDGTPATFDISYYMSGAVMTIRKTSKQVKTNLPVVWECTYSPDNRLIFEHTNHDKDSIPSVTFGQPIQRDRDGRPEYGISMFNRVLFKKDNGTAPESTKVFDKFGRTIFSMEGDYVRHWTYRSNSSESQKALMSFIEQENGKTTIYNFEYNDANLCTYASCTKNGKIQYETFITRDSVAKTVHHVDYSNQTEWWAPLNEQYGFEPTPGHLEPCTTVYFKSEEEYEEYRKKELNKLSMREMMREMPQLEKAQPC